MKFSGKWTYDLKYVKAATIIFKITLINLVYVLNFSVCHYLAFEMKYFYKVSFIFSETTNFDDCQRVVNEPGLLVSPSNPFYYGHVTPCTWSIDFLDGSFVRVHVLHINLAVPDTQAGLLNVGLFNFLYLFRSQIMILFLHRVFFFICAFVVAGVAFDHCF